jgi:ATP-dependent helicase/nuclease subunit A
VSATAETDKIAPAPDQPSRDAIERQVDATMHVSAGAGSGKTTALVARVLEYVRLGRPLDALVVITFSTAAASTLRTRIRQALLKAQREDPRLEYAAALDALQAAPISTLHAFARRVIAEFPVEANVPPGFDVSGPTNASIDFDTWWSSRLIALFDDPDLEWALERVDALEVRPHRYRDIACWLYENYDQVPPDIAAQIRTTAPPIDVSELLAAIDAYLHYCGAGNCSDPSDKLAEFGHAVFDYGAGLRATDDRHAPLELLDALLVLPKRASKGRQTSWRDVEEARRLSDAVIRAHGEGSSACIRSCTTHSNPSARGSLAPRSTSPRNGAGTASSCFTICSSSPATWCAIT